MYWTKVIFGRASRDTLHIGDLSIPNFFFQEAFTVDDMLVLEDEGVLSVLGLGRLPYKTDWADLTAEHPFLRMLNGGMLDLDLFSLLPPEQDQVGELVFGGVNAAYLQGQTATLEIAPSVVGRSIPQEALKGGWQVHARSASLGDDIVADLSNKTAVFTTLTDTLGLPPPLYSRLSAAIEDNMACDKRHLLPKFTLGLGLGDRSYDFILSPEDYIRPRLGSSGGCWPIFGSVEDDESFIFLGKHFIDQFYNVFDAGNREITRKSKCVVHCTAPIVTFYQLPCDRRNSGRINKSSG